MKAILTVLIFICLAVMISGCGSLSRILGGHKTMPPGPLQMGLMEGSVEVFENSVNEFRCMKLFPLGSDKQDSTVATEDSARGESADYDYRDPECFWTVEPPSAGHFTNPKSSLFGSFVPSEVEHDTKATIIHEIQYENWGSARAGLEITIKDSTLNDWQRTWGQAMSVEMAIDSNGNAYTAGVFYRTTDFDPTSKTAEFTAEASTDKWMENKQCSFYLSKFGASGEYKWTKTWIGMSQGEHPICLAVDPAGNIYFAGQFSGTVDFDPGPGTASLTSPDNKASTFVSCFSPDGAFVRVFALGENSEGQARPYDMKFSRGGNLYMTGGFTGTVDFDSGEGISLAHADRSGVNEVFLLKLNPDGSFGWVRTWGKNSEYYSGSGEEMNVGVKLAVDGEESVFVAGEFAGTVDMDPGDGIDQHIANERLRDVFLSKFGSDGQFQWCKTWGGPENEQVFGLDVDSSGNPCVAGVFKGKVDFEPGPASDERKAATREEVGYVCCDPKQVIRSTIEGSVFLSKFNTTGDREWTRDWSYLLDTYSRREKRVAISGDLATDNNGRILVTSGFSGAIDLDPGEGEHEISWKGSPGDGVYLSVIDPEGKFVTAELWGSLISQAYAVAAGVDPAGNAYVFGMLGSDSVLRKFPLGDQSIVFGDVSTVQSEPVSPAQGGVSQEAKVPYKGGMNSETGWVLTWSGKYYESALGVATDKDDNIYTTGRWGMTMDIDPGPKVDERTALGNTDIFLFKVNRSGDLLSAQTWGADQGSLYGNDVEVDSAGNIILSGGFNVAFDIDPGPGVTNLTPSNKYNEGLIAKFAPNGTLIWATPGAGGNDMAIDPQDNIWVTGSKTDEQGGGWFYSWKVDPSGKILQGNRSFGLPANEGKGRDSSGNRYQAGIVNEKTSFGGGSDSAGLPPLIKGNLYLAKHGPSNILIWVKTWGPSEDWAQSNSTVAVDPSGNPYVYGYYDAPMDFDPGPGETVLPAYGYKRAFICKFTPDGNFQWAHGFGSDGAQPNLVHDIAFDREGNVYAAGQFNGVTDFCPGERVYEVATPTFSNGAFLLKIKPDGTW